MSGPILTVKFYGTRGSIPVSEPGYQEYGGNTTCISYQASDLDELVIIDAGTGIRKLGKEILSGKLNFNSKHISLGLSHFHWDHIQGFPFFAPAYHPEYHINIIAMGKGRPVNNVKELFDVQMREVFFPVALHQLSANIDFQSPKVNFEIFGKTKVSMVKHKHPGTAFSFRLERGGKSLVICTDIEHGDKLDERIVKLAKDADVLIHDAQYTNEEYQRKKGWGHSTYDQAIEVAERANCKYLFLTHHDPDHDDNFLKKREQECQERFKNCWLAKEGLEFKW